MRALLTALALAAAGLNALPPVHAAESDAMKQAREVQKREADEADRAYRAAIKNTSHSNKPVQVDPWSNARDTKPAAPAK